MPFSAADIAELLRRGREQMLMLPLPALASTIAQVLPPLVDAALYACVLDEPGEPVAVIDARGEQHPEWVRARERHKAGDPLGELLRPANMTILSAPIAFDGRRFGELGLGWQQKIGSEEAAVLQEALASWGQWLAMRLWVAQEASDANGPGFIVELMGPLLHEFNNFLNTTALQMAILESELPESAVPDLHVIRNQSNAVARVIRQFQRYRDKQRPQPQPLDLGAVLRAAAKDWQSDSESVARLEKPQVRFELPGDLPRVSGVKRECICLGRLLLSQIAASLPADERALTIRAERDGDRVLVHLAGAAPTTAETPGPAEEGLELAACRSIVRRLYGKMRTRWSAGGLAVTIELPAAK